MARFILISTKIEEQITDYIDFHEDAMIDHLNPERGCDSDVHVLAAWMMRMGNDILAMLHSWAMGYEA